MKRLIIAIVVAAFAFPSLSFAQKRVNEYGEEDLYSPDLVEQVAPIQPAVKKSSGVEEYDINSSASKAKGKPANEAALPDETEKPAAASVSAPPPYTPTAEGRAKSFQVGFVGPGFAYVTRGYGPAMTFGLEGDYYFYERLSAGVRFEMETKFKSPTIISFVPHARYVFDFDDHPRWAVYAQAGVGVAISAGNGSYAACDIAIPAGGFWWQWKENWSLGAETGLHIYARSNVAVGWNISPAIRYTF
ncbi:MAG TPA: hypothetical protein PLZ86_00870 [bacterium]|nr:hypothetical protein [bacterium]